MKRFKNTSKKIFSLHHTKVKRAKKLRNHPFVVPVVTFLSLFVATAVVFIALNGGTVLPDDSHIVKLSVEGKERTVPTQVATVGELLQRLNITLGKNDVVEPSQDTKIQEDNFRVNVYRARAVTIVDGPQVVHADSVVSTPRSVARQAGIAVYPEDSASVEPVDNVLKEGIGQKIVITRATPLELNLYGTQVTVRTHAKTVEDLLKEKNVKLAKDDNVQPALTTPLTPNVQVFVLRSGTQIATVEETVPTPIQTIEDASLSFGTTVLRQQGTPGKKLVTYQIDLKNGKEVGRHIIQEAIVVAPVKQIVARGKTVQISGDRTGVMAAAGIPSDQYAAVNYIISRESNWRLNARNAGGCLGLGQRCPGSVLINACPNWEFDAACQLRHFSAYANGRYGSWNGAYAFWQNNHYW
jgi:uncharacterized protein YabE (DUF348 family)